MSSPSMNMSNVGPFFYSGELETSKCHEILVLLEPGCGLGMMGSSRGQEVFRWAESLEEPSKAASGRAIFCHWWLLYLLISWLPAVSRRPRLREGRPGGRGLAVDPAGTAKSSGNGRTAVV